MNSAKLLFLTVIFLTGAILQGQSNPSVRFHTNLGDIDVTLTLDTTPATVVNFLSYLNAGAYSNSIFHRSVPGFIIQGGGYQLVNHAPVAIPQNSPVRNEFKASNTRGTIAMAKLGNDPNSATDQWFFNLADNSSNLDSQNGGFTVFGTVTAGLDVMDKIAAVPVYNQGSPFDQIPLQNYKTGIVPDGSYILVTSIEQLVTVPAPSISSNGIVSASAFGAFSNATVGSYIEIYGNNLAGTSRGWTTADFTGSAGTKAPTSLDGVTVTINGVPAFVCFVSPTQVNVQVPIGVPKGKVVPVVVTYRGQPSKPYSLTIDPYEPGLLAPASFKIGSKQYVAAVHGANNALVATSGIAGVAASPAVPGETIVIYGVGWGDVITTASYTGEINQSLASLDASVQFSIGSSTAQVTYSGLSPGLVGVDQFNVVVPANAPNGDLPVTATLNGTAIAQTLFLPVRK